MSLEAAREAAFQRISQKLGMTLIRKGKANRGTSNGETNVVCLVSKSSARQVGATSYWYGLTQSQKTFLDEAANGYVALACLENGKTFLIPRDEVNGWLPNLHASLKTVGEAEIVAHWHIYINDYGDRIELSQGVQPKVELSQYLI